MHTNLSIDCIPSPVEFGWGCEDKAMNISACGIQTCILYFTQKGIDCVAVNFDNEF